jgi:hypothetical protein
VTVIARGRGCHVIARFTGGGRAVMTGGTSAGRNGTVIERGRFPCTRAVAAIARRRGRNVKSRLSARRGAVMTRCTSAGRNRTMIECRRSPRRGAVAAIARRRGRDMSGGLAGCATAVMTGDAAPGRNDSVIEAGRSPRCGAMTRVARRAGRNVVTGLACGCLPVVAPYAFARGAAEAEGTVVKDSSGPYRRGMAQITLRAGWDVIRRFSCCRYMGSARVTSGTDSWCTFEYSADVAGFTSHGAMRAPKREPCFEVIEAAAWSGCASLVLGQL